MLVISNIYSLMTAAVKYIIIEIIKTLTPPVNFFLFYMKKIQIFGIFYRHKNSTDRQLVLM